jgi:NDP-sugar pyrophosphorylase family protein
VKGFILAAGFGERLRPITEFIPKPLVPVGNLPLIAYSIKLLAHHGINDIIINLHHLGKAIREALGDGEAYGVRITYSEEEEILGTGGGLKKMHEQLADETFVVVNSDTILDLDLHQLIDSHTRRGALATMVVRTDPRQAEFGQIEVDQSGRMRKILGHGECDEPLRPFMFAGVHVLEPRFLEYIPPDVNTCINRYAYVKALSNNELIGSFVMDGYFADCGTPERYYQANVDALDQVMKLRHADPLSGFALAPRREVAEVVRMGKDVELGQGVNILPPVLLGDGVRLGEHATVGPYAILQAGVNVGKEAVVAHSVVLENVKLEPGTRVLRTLASKRANLELKDGAGAG